MTLLDLLEQDGIRLKPSFSDQLSGPCPECGGDDRFCVWPNQDNGGRWWCRRCEKKGDAIQYLREFRGMGYREACELLGKKPRGRSFSLRERTPKAKRRDNWTPKETSSPVALWQEAALAFLAVAEKALWGQAGQWSREWLHWRGLREETIRAAHLGWNSSDRPMLHRPSKAGWGLEEVIDGKPGGTLWLPKGLVIPLLQGGQVARLRVRRFEGEEPKYVQIPGSTSVCMALGSYGLAAVVIESELDALLLHQEASDLIGVVALGSVSIRPDERAFEILSQAETILISLDSDEAGAKESWGWWQDHFPWAKRWPVPIGKDPGEAWQKGLNLRAWVVAGMPSNPGKACGSSIIGRPPRGGVD